MSLISSSLDDLYFQEKGSGPNDVRTQLAADLQRQNIPACTGSPSVDAPLVRARLTEIGGFCDIDADESLLRTRCGGVHGADAFRSDSATRCCRESFGMAWQRLGSTTATGRPHLLLMSMSACATLRLELVSKIAFSSSHVSPTSSNIGSSIRAITEFVNTCIQVVEK